MGDLLLLQDAERAAIQTQAARSDTAITSASITFARCLSGKPDAAEQNFPKRRRYSQVAEISYIVIVRQKCSAAAINAECAYFLGELHAFFGKNAQLPTQTKQFRKCFSKRNRTVSDKVCDQRKGSRLRQIIFEAHNDARVQHVCRDRNIPSCLT